MYVTHTKFTKMLKKKIVKRQTEAGKQKLEKKKLSIELEKLKEGKKAVTIAASKSVQASEAKIFAIGEKLRKF